MSLHCHRIALVGLDMSQPSRYNKAYQELVEFIDEGKALSLEKVMKVGL